MNVPPTWPKPSPGKFFIRCQGGWGSGWWHLYDSRGRVLKSGAEVFACLDERTRLEKAQKA